MGCFAACQIVILLSYSSDHLKVYVVLLGGSVVSVSA